jgi:hypothetical protein
MLKRLSLVLLLPVALLVVPAMTGGAGASGVFTCSNEIVSGSFNGNVNVPSGSICALSGLTLSGGVTVQSGGGLLITNASKLGGGVLSVFGPAANFHPANFFSNSNFPSFNGSIFICGSTVGGIIDVTNPLNQVTIGAPSSGRFFDQFNHCPGNTVGSSILLTGVQGGAEVVNNSINGSVIIKNTVGCPNDEDGCNAGTGSPPSVEVTGNSIAGNLTCTNSQNGVDVHDNLVKGHVSCSNPV